MMQLNGMTSLLLLLEKDCYSWLIEMLLEGTNEAGYTENMNGEGISKPK
jgi:hypothetical protein